MYGKFDNFIAGLIPVEPYSKINISDFNEMNIIIDNFNC